MQSLNQKATQDNRTTPGLYNGVDDIVSHLENVRDRQQLKQNQPVVNVRQSTHTILDELKFSSTSFPALKNSTNGDQTSNS
jgi:hypothetical protein